ncbi:MAG TPA: S8 family serine peptidase [Lysobacter sp.]|nr:S8 family serine peptidase [Lysobacter sp.]
MNAKSPGLKVSILTVTAASVLAVTAAHAGELIRTRGHKVDGQYIVVFRDDAAALSSERSRKPKAAAVAADMARAHGAKLRYAYGHALRGFAVNASESSLKRLLDDPRVAYVEEDAVVFADTTQPNATWGLDRIDQRSIDRRDGPPSSSYSYDTTAATVHAYIIDTGVRASHTDFGDRVSGGYSAINDGNGTADCNGHGTHVAGTVGGATWGVAKAVRLHPVRVLGCNGSGSNADVIAGMDWVTQNHVRPAVANMSLGGGASTATDDAVARLVSAGVVVAVAAGNDNSNACNYSPARAASAITVGSTTSSDARSSFSNYGSCVDLFAPGSSITSTWSIGDTATNAISGTSMASPHVAGVAALYLANNPSATPGQVTTAILNNASSNKVSDPMGSPNRLLHSLFSGGTPTCNSIGGTLTNGAAARNLCSSAGAELRFTLSVPAGARDLKFMSSGGSGDADLYVRFGSEPSTAAYDCKSEGSSSAGICAIASAQTGTYHVLVKAYATFAGVSLTGGYSAGGGGRSGSNTGNCAVSDTTTVESLVAISATGTASSAAHVNVDIRHSCRGDLRVDLVAPDGTTYLLKNYGSSDSADNVIATYSVNLSSEQRNGVWKLRLGDNAAGDIGYIDAWSISL